MSQLLKQRIKRTLPVRIRPYASRLSARGRNVADRISRLPNLVRPKIFCISVQRTGTTSVGKFFLRHDYDVAYYPIAYRNDWKSLWFNGQYEQIFRSEDFRLHQVFEDSPWWYPRFYRMLFHRFPRSKFILFTRDPDRWFNSMVNHSDGKNLGNAYVHASIYRRDSEFYRKYDGTPNVYSNVKDKLMDIKDHRDHYIDFYTTRNRKAIDFFEYNDPSRLIHCRLEDEDKWQRLGDFFGIDVSPTFAVHANASDRDGVVEEHTTAQ